MYLFGCLPFIAIILLLVVISLVRGLLKTTVDVLYGLWLTLEEWFYGLFRPTPTESYIEDMNYYHPTEERPKLYAPDDGEYVSYKSIKR